MPLKLLNSIDYDEKKGTARSVPRDERLCSICAECRLEDEKHFLVDFPFYNEERNSLKLWLLVVKNIDFDKLDLTQKLEILFKNSNPEYF